MTDAPSWAVSVPSTPAVHTEPPSTAQWQNLTQAEINALRDKLLESIWQVLVQLLTGGLSLGESAASQLVAWADDLPLIGPLVEALTGVLGGTLATLSTDPLLSTLIPSLTGAWTGTIAASVLTGAINTGVTISGNAISSLFNGSGALASALTGALNPSVTFLVGASNIALSTLLQNLSSTGSFAASAVTGPLNTAVTISGNAISSLFNSSGALASELTGAINPGVTIGGNAVNTLFDSGGLIASKITGALNPSITFLVGSTNVSLSTLFSGINASGELLSSELSGVINQTLIPSLTAGWGNTIAGSLLTGSVAASLISGALSSATIAGSALTGLATGIGTWLTGGGALPALTTLASTGLTGLATGIGSWLGAGGALPSATTLASTGLTGLATGIGTWLGAGGALPSATTMASTALTGLATGIGTWLGAGGLLPSATTLAGSGVTGALNSAVTLAGNAISSMFNGTGLVASFLNVLDASKITTGVFGTGLIPNLNASIITAGTFATGLIPNITKAMSTDMQTIVDNVYQAINGGSSTGNTLASIKTNLLNIPGVNIVSSVLASIVPALDASKITTGTFANSFLPGVLPLNLWQASTVAGNNLVISPNFEDSTITRESTLGAGASIVYSTDQHNSGTQSLKFTTGPVSNSDLVYLAPNTVGGMASFTPAAAVKVWPGQWYYSEIYVRAKSTNTTTAGFVGIEAFLIDSTGVNVTTALNLTNFVNMSGMSSSAWTKLSAWVQIPSGYDLLFPFVWCASQNVANQVFYFDDVRIVEETVSQSIIQQLFNSTAIGPALNTALTVAGQTVATVQSNAQGVLDAIENASNGVVSGAVNTLVSDTQTNMNNLFNAIPNFLQGVAGFFGQSDLNTALSASSATTSGLQSGLSGTQAQIAAIFNVSPSTAGTVNQTIDFSTIANQSGMSGIMLPGTGSGNGFLGVTSGYAVLQSNTSGSVSDIEIFPTATTSDYQVIDVTLGPLNDILSGNALLRVLGRVNSTRDTYVFIDVYAAGGVPQVDINCVVSNSLHALVGAVAVPSMSTGGKLRMVLGDPVSSSPYAMQVLYNGTAIITVPSATGLVSQVGASFRNVGLNPSSTAIGKIPASVKTVTYQDNPPTSALYPFSGTPAAGTKGRLYTCSDVGLTQRDNGLNWERIQGGPLGWFTAPPTSGWSQVNQVASSAMAADKDALLYTVPSSASASFRGQFRTLSPASNYTASFYLESTTPVASESLTGIALRNSSSGSLVVFEFGVSAGTNSTDQIIQVVNMTNPSTVSSVVKGANTVGWVGGIPNWMRWRDDGTNRYAEYSFNGVDWVTYFSVGRTSFITPDQIGIVVWNNSSGSTIYQRLRSLAGVS